MPSSAAREKLKRPGPVGGKAGAPVAIPPGMFFNEPLVGGANDGPFANAEEPLLSDLLNDPMTHQMMESDGVKQRHLMLVIAEVQARLNGA